MRLVFIVLLLAACAPMAATQTPGAAASYPSITPPVDTASAAPPAGITTTTAASPRGTQTDIPASGQPPPAGTRAAGVPAFDLTPGAEPHAGPAAFQLLQKIDAARLHGDLLTLQGFHTRHSASATSTDSNEIGAARAWLIGALRAISPRVQVETDSFAFPFGSRTLAAQNIIATLPGRVNPPQVIIISAHYDSRTIDISDVRSPAPGANDDGSGVAAVLELARQLSTQPLDATYEFILFAGEEEGLFGSVHLAPLMRKNGVRVVAMLNDDIIGNVTGPDGQRVDNRVRVLSGDPDGGPSRQLAAEAKTIVEGALPGFGVELVPSLYHGGRGGDHIAFHYAGFPAIRFIEAVENLAHQHNANDRVEFMDMTYLASVVRANLAVALELGRMTGS